MEDFLSILIVVLIAVAGAASKQKKKKKKAPDSKGPLYGTSGTDKGFGEMKEFIRDVGKAVLEMDEDEAPSPAKMNKPVRMKAKPAAQPVKAAAAPAKPVAGGRQLSIIEEGLSKAPVSTQGYSLFEDKGCISGSIAHDSHEGDSKYPYGVYEGRFADDDPITAGEIAGELQSMNVQRLRRAIVVSEILDRPKALRRR